MMKRIITAFIAFVSVSVSFAQPDSGFVLHKGIMAMIGTVGIGEMTSLKISNAYITGNLEYFPRSDISIRGDGFLLVNSLSQNSILKQNSSLYFGAFYHFKTHSGFDPHIGFQPGAGITKMVAPDIYGNPGIYYDAAMVCPLASLVVGFNYFGEKWFHIQCDVRYAIGQYLAPGSATGVLADEYNISEISFNFGLGFNFDMLKGKN